MLSAALSSDARVCTVRVPAGMRSNSSVAQINGPLLFTLCSLCYVFGEAPETRVDDEQITTKSPQCLSESFYSGSLLTPEGRYLQSMDVPKVRV